MMNKTIAINQVEELIFLFTKQGSLLDVDLPVNYSNLQKRVDTMLEANRLNKKVYKSVRILQEFASRDMITMDKFPGVG